MEQLLASLGIMLVGQLGKVLDMQQRRANGEQVTAADVQALQSDIDQNTAKIEELRKHQDVA